MKVKINIELWDNTTTETMDKIGLTSKFLETCYQVAFEQLVNEVCSESPDMNHTLTVEVVDNTIG